MMLGRCNYYWCRTLWIWLLGSTMKNVGKNPLIIEKGNIVNSIYHYPTHQTFFSTSEKLEIGNIPFITESYKPNEIRPLYTIAKWR